MRKRLLRLFRDQRGAGAAEFAMVLPAFVVLLVGIAQIGVVFFANAGLHNALAEGARLATLYPRPTTQDITDKIAASRFGLDPEKLDAPAVIYGNTAGADFAEITMRYNVTLDFIFFDVPPITLEEKRRVFLQPLPAA